MAKSFLSTVAGLAFDRGLIADVHEHNPRYGYLWQLGEGAFHAQGGGGNRIFVDPSRDLVIVTRWVDDPDAVIAEYRDRSA